MISARGLSRDFGGRAAVRDLDFDIADGDVVGFLGPNGAGKTTTMRCLLGLLEPSDGTVELERPAGYLPERFVPYDALSVRSYLRFMAKMKGVDVDDVDRVVGVAGVADLARRPCGRLSRGQRQRVGIAQSLLGAPRSLVLDEPTQGLDPRQVVEARAVVRAAAAEGAAVLLSTHLLAEAVAVCDRVVVLVGGRLVADERPTAGVDLEKRFLQLVAEAELS